MKKIIGIIKKIIIGILAVAFFGFAMSITVLLLNYNEYGVTQIGNTSLVLIKGEISSNNYKKGDLVLVEGKKVEKIKIGDEIFVYQIDKDGNANIDLGKVGKISTGKESTDSDDVIAFENGDTYAMDFVIGAASKVYNKVGTYLSILQSKWGFLFIILVPSFLIFMYEISALVIEIKYGKDDVIPNNANVAK